MKPGTHRRNFLKAAGISIALPAMETYARVSPFAAEVATPKRMITICTTLGLHGPNFFPQQTGADYKATPYLKPLDEFRDQFTVFSGLSHPNQAGKDGHSSQMTWLTAAENPGLSGFRNSISLDQLAAQKLGYVTRFPSLTLSTDSTNSQSYTNSGVMVPAEHRPSKIFADLFLEGNANDVRRQQKLLNEGRSILDAIGFEAKRLKGRVSAADGKRLDEYYNSIREAENHINQASDWLDRAKPKVDQKQPRDIDKDNDLIGRTDLMLGLLPLIVQTDSSRVIALTVHGRGDVPIVEGVTDGHHNLSHHGQDENKIEQLFQIESALMESVGGLLKGLTDKKEGQGTLLDNTMVVFGSNLGNANSHDWRNLPIIAAGGGFKHGKHVAFDKENNAQLGKLYLSVLEKMGIESDKFGSSGSTLDW